MARPANPNKEKIADTKAEIKTVSKVVRAGETAAKKKEKLEAKLEKLTGDAPVKTAKATKPAKVSSKTSSKDKASSKDSAKKSTTKPEKGKLQVVNKKRGRPKKTDEDED